MYKSFIKEETDKEGKYVKRCSGVLAFMEMPITTKMRCHFIYN